MNAASFALQAGAANAGKCCRQQVPPLQLPPPLTSNSARDEVKSGHWEATIAVKVAVVGVVLVLAAAEFRSTPPLAIARGLPVRLAAAASHLA